MAVLYDDFDEPEERDDAAYLGIGTWKLYDLIGRGFVPTVRLDGISDLRIHRPTLDARVAQLAEEQSPEQAKPVPLFRAQKGGTR